MRNANLPVRLVMWGVGRVGQAFLKLLHTHPQLMAACADRSLRVAGLADSRDAILLDEAQDLHEILRQKAAVGRLPIPEGNHHSNQGWPQWLKHSRADVLIDSSVSEFENPQPALDLYRHALGCGVSVISANKPPLVHGLKELLSVAGKHGTRLRYGAAVGASLPVWDLLSILSRQDQPCRLEAVLNGTTNWIITEMETKSLPYQESLLEAQRRGFAEPDPKRDVTGWDTAAKLLILANSFWKESFSWSDIAIKGIEQLTPDYLTECRDQGFAVKLVGRLFGSSGNWQLSVQPETLELCHPLAGLGGTQKGIFLETESGGRYTLAGGASGAEPTAASMVRELLEILC